jgi:hypothetical protein
LAESDEATFAQGRLICLPFDDWSQLDGTFAWNARDYEESRPVFCDWEVEFPDDVDLMMIPSQISDWLPRIHIALLLARDTPLLPDPRLSVIYIRFEPAYSDPFVLRLVGVFERISLVQREMRRIRTGNVRTV